MEIDPKNKPSFQAEQQKTALRFMVWGLATEFGFIIALPLIAFVYLGKWLDAKYHSKAFILIGLFLALTLSSIYIGKKINDIRKRIK